MFRCNLTHILQRQQIDKEDSRVETTNPLDGRPKQLQKPGSRLRKTEQDIKRRTMSSSGRRGLVDDNDDL